MNTTPADSHLTGLRPLLPPAITAAFAAAAALLIAAYILHFPGLHLPGPLVAALLIAALASALYRAITPAGKPLAPRVGPLAGFAAGLLTLLALGSDLTDKAQLENAPPLPLMAAGWLALTTAIGSFAGLAAKRAATHTPLPNHAWTPRLAIVAAAATLALITMGGIVTAAEAGLAVPDWPATFGANMFLFPLSKMTGGVYYEHAHRLMGAFVGLTTIALAVMCIRNSRGALLKTLAIAATLLVIIQGVAGGIRVTETSVPLAIAHAVTAQIFFSLIALIALASSDHWRAHPTARTTSTALPIAAAAVVFLQIALGAVARHLPDSLHGVFTHAGFSIVAATLVIVAAARAAKAAEPAKDPLLRTLAKAATHTLGLQMTLGVAALAIVLITRDRQTPHALDLTLTTAHQVVGAIVLAATVLLAARSAQRPPAVD